MIIGWAYLEPAVITQTENAVSAIKSPFMWLDAFTFLRNKLNFIVFFSNFRMFSQEMQCTRANWTRYGGHMVKAKGEHNSG